MNTKLMTEELIRFDVEAKNREEVIFQMSQLMEQDGRLVSREGYEKDVLIREGQSSTAIGFFTATPHAKSDRVLVPSLAFMRLKQPIRWDEKEDVSLVFQVAVPATGQGDRHLEILAALFRKLIHDDFREDLMKAETAADVLGLVGEL